MKFPMMQRVFLSGAVLLLAAACKSATPAGSATVVMPGRPGEESRVVEAGRPANAPSHTAADVESKGIARLAR
jgi:hypothetical protein